MAPTASVSPKEPSSIKTLLYEYTPEEGARPLPLVVVLSSPGAHDMAVATHPKGNFSVFSMIFPVIFAQFN